MYTITITFSQGFLNRSIRSRKNLCPGKLGTACCATTRRRLPSVKALVECGVFGVGLFQNGNVGIRVFPQGEKVLVGGAGFGLIAGESVSAGDAQVGKNADDFVGDDTGPIENFLKFRGSSKTLARCEAGGAAQVGGIKEEIDGAGGVRVADFVKTGWRKFVE